MMKLKWRQQETVFWSFLLAMALFRVLGTALLAHDTLDQQYGLNFNDTPLQFNFWINYFFPLFLPLVALYLAYFFINYWLIPVSIIRRKQIAASVLYCIALYAAISLVFAISYYFEAIYLKYSIGQLRLKERSIRYGFSISGRLFLFYLAFCLLRQRISNLVLGDHPHKAFRMYTANSILGAAFTYLAFLFFFIYYGVFRNDVLPILYLFFVLPLLITCLINILWLYPYFEKKGFRLFQRSWRLLLVPFVLATAATLIFQLSAANGNFVFFLAVWFFQYLFGIPLSWLIYHNQRNLLSRIHQLEKNLGQTTADLQFLRAQINPHFLFNALNTIYGTALQENAGRTASAVQQLGDMMRFMLEENHLPTIPLIRDIEYLRNFISLQQLRIQPHPNIQIQTSLPEAGCHYQIAPMLLLPFVENAFKHGVRLNTASWINISLSCDNRGLHFDVHNSLHPKLENDPENNRSGIGLENVKQRLLLLYPGKYQLTIRQTNLEYYIHLDINLSS